MRAQPGANHASSRDESGDGRRRWLWAVLVGAGLLGLIVLLRWPFPTVQRWAQDIFEVDQSAGPDRGINVNEVAHSTERLAGKRVTVSATVSEVLGPHALVVGHEGFKVTGGGEDEILVVAGQDSLLVVSAEPLPSSLRAGMVLQVDGTIRRYEPARMAELERELGVQFQNRRALVEAGVSGVLVASAVRPAPPVTGPGDKEDPESTDGPERGVDINEVVHNPEQYIGRTVTVSGEVETRLTPHALLLSDDKLLVVSADFGPEMMEEATAFVTGTIRRLDLAALEAELGVDLADEALARFTGQPTLVARSVQVVR